MGLGQQIAIKGGSIIAAILLVAYAASKTNILERIKTGLPSTGLAVGQGIGGALAAIPVGIGQGGAGVLEQGVKSAQEWFGKNQGQPVEWWKGLLGPWWFPSAATEPSNGAPINVQPSTPDNTVINQSNRDYSDSIPFFARPRAGTTIKAVTTSGGRITSVTRRVSSSAVKAAASPARLAHIAAVKRRAVARAKRRGKKCFNSDVDFGGTGHIDYRDEIGYGV